MGHANKKSSSFEFGEIYCYNPKCKEELHYFEMFWQQIWPSANSTKAQA